MNMNRRNFVKGAVTAATAAAAANSEALASPSPKHTPKPSIEAADPTIVEISDAKLHDLLESADLKIGVNVRVIKALEVNAGAVIAKQYDR